MGVPAPVHQAGIDRDQGSEGCPVRIPFLVRVAAIHTQSLPTGPVSSGQDERVRGSTGLMRSGGPARPPVRTVRPQPPWDPQAYPSPRRHWGA